MNNKAIIGLVFVGLALAVVSGLLIANATGLFFLPSYSKSIIKSIINSNIINYKPDYSKVININLIKLTPQQVLDYNSMSDIKYNLQNMIIGNVSGVGTTTAYNIVLMLLNNGYNGFKDNYWKQQFLNTQLSKYALGPEFSTFTSEYYKRNYIILVTHSLWVEMNNVIAWSLRDYSKSDINNLFWLQGLHNQDIPVISFDSNQVYAENDQFYTENISTELFLIANKFKKTNQLDTIYEIIKWEEKNFFHAYTDYGWINYRDGRTDAQAAIINADGSPTFYPLSLKRVFDERITGCHENALIFSNLLRSLNIPAVDITFSGHGVTYLPTIQRYVHGDHLADFAVVPPEGLLLTTDQAKVVLNPEYYDKPIRDKYKSKYYFTNIELYRNKNNLFLYTDSVCINIPTNDWNKIKTQAFEYTLNYIQQDCNIYSNYVPIKTLSELSNCKLDSDCGSNLYCSISGMGTCQDLLTDKQSQFLILKVLQGQTVWAKDLCSPTRNNCASGFSCKPASGNAKGLYVCSK